MCAFLTVQIQQEITKHINKLFRKNPEIYKRKKKYPKMFKCLAILVLFCSVMGCYSAVAKSFLLFLVKKSLYNTANKIQFCYPRP